LGDLYELEEGFGTVVVDFGQTFNFGDANLLKTCYCDGLMK